MLAQAFKQPIPGPLTRFTHKLTTAEQAVSGIKPGDKVLVGNACATPQTLLTALERIKSLPADIQLFHFFTTGALPRQDVRPSLRYRHKFFTGADTREDAIPGYADYVPLSLPQACTPWAYSGVKSGSAPRRFAGRLHRLDKSFWEGRPFFLKRVPQGLLGSTGKKKQGPEGPAVLKGKISFDYFFIFFLKLPRPSKPVPKSSSVAGSGTGAGAVLRELKL